MDRILEPVAERFGKATADRAEQFLSIQARLGIKRKTLGMLEDPKMIAAVEAEMAQLRAQMETAQRELGVYAMVFLRMIYPENNNPVYSLLQQRTAATDKSLAATGRWTNLRPAAKQPDGK
jgi:hypothetical protein